MNDNDTAGQLSTACSRLQRIQYGTAGQSLFAGTRGQLAAMLLFSIPKDERDEAARSDIAFIECVTRNSRSLFQKPTVVVLHTSGDTGADVVVLVLNGCDEFPHVEFRVGIKTTSYSQVAAEERRRNAVTSLLQGAYTHTNGKPRQKDKDKVLQKDPEVDQHDNFYGLSMRALDTLVSHDDVPTAGNLPMFVRMRVELSASARTSGTQPHIYNDGRVLDIVIDKENLGELVQVKGAIDALLTASSRDSSSFVNAR